jgi:hypothetical protein
MTWYMPDEPGVLSRRTASPDIYGLHDLPQIYKFAEAYRDVAVGWHFALKMTKAGLELPGIFDYKDSAVCRAYWYMRGKSDPLMRTVVAIGRLEEFESVRQAINCYIVCRALGKPKDTLKLIADKTQMSMEVINAYEKLFFNVLDRVNDDKFLRGVVYPKTRIVESDSSYLDTESVEGLLLRTAYNNGERQLQHMLGDRDIYVNQDEAKVFAEKLEATLMANGMFMAQNGFLSDGRNQAIRHARGLLAAAKAGGAETAVDNTLKNAGEVMYAEMKHLQQHAMDVMTPAQFEDE